MILVDDRTGIFQPTKRNILAAMDWLVSEPDCQCFLHYSGHGGQVIDRQGDRKSGLDDTIVPVDYGNNGPIDSGTLHRALVSKLAHNSNLFVVFDCCHSGSALELPYVYRTDDNGNINLVNSVKEGITLMSAAQRLLQGGFSFSKITNAKHLFVRGKRFVTGLKYSGKRREEGLGEEHFQEDWKREGKDVVMFSGCRDDQTSADANIGGNHVGAMSWALLNTLNSGRNLSYVQVCGRCCCMLMRLIGGYRCYRIRGV